MKTLEIYTDGACAGNPGPGGWGVYMIYDKHEKKLYGTAKSTTNNKMELTAAIEALAFLKKRCTINLYTDSKYLRDGITKWIFGWKKNNWKNSAKQPVKNQELWQKLDLLASKHDIKWIWVKAHANNKGNIIADELAVKGRDEALVFKNNPSLSIR